MSATSFELEVHRQQQNYGYYGDQLQGNSLGNQCCGGLLGQQYLQPYINYYYCSGPRDLHNFEIAIEQLSTDAEPLLNYGAKLRLLMADPIKGHDLREAISQLKTALKEAIKNAI